MVEENLQVDEKENVKMKCLFYGKERTDKIQATMGRHWRKRSKDLFQNGKPTNVPTFAKRKKYGWWFPWQGEHRMSRNDFGLRFGNKVSVVIFW